MTCSLRSPFLSRSQPALARSSLHRQGSAALSLRSPLTAEPLRPARSRSAGNCVARPASGLARDRWVVGVEYPRDCAVVTRVLGATGSRLFCTAPARWLLVSPPGPIRLEWSACNVHRAELVDYLLPSPCPPGWAWHDRRDCSVWAAHSGCYGSSSFGRRQTCQGAGSPSRVFCPLTVDQSSGNPSGAERRGHETLLR